MTLAKQILQQAAEKGLTITTAESCTGGMVAAAITDISGSSAIFERGFVTYSNFAKQDMLAVRVETLDSHGAVSEPVAQEMAIGARKAAHSDIAVAISGIAGPGGSEFKPEGRVCFATATATDSFVETIEYGAPGRAEVRAAARDHALFLILKAIQAA